MNPFDAKAADWDTPAHIERAQAVGAAIRATVPLGPGTRVIDIGAGTGLLGRALAADVGSVLVTDPSPGMLAAAARAASAAGLANVATRQFTLAADPVPDERFDLAVSLMSLHHVLDTGAAVRDLAALLEPAGWIAMADLDTEDGSFHVDPDDRARVLFGFDRASLGRLVQSAGFVEASCNDVWRMDKNGRTYSLFLLTARKG